MHPYTCTQKLDQLFQNKEKEAITNRLTDRSSYFNLGLNKLLMSEQQIIKHRLYGIRSHIKHSVEISYLSILPSPLFFFYHSSSALISLSPTFCISSYELFIVPKSSLSLSQSSMASNPCSIYLTCESTIP